MSRFTPWLWLVIGTVLTPFVNFQTQVPIAAWLAAIFLLRFARSQRLRVSVPVLITAHTLALAVGLRGGFFPWEIGLGYYGFLLLIGVFATLPYVTDRLLVPRLGPFAGTLVLPLTATVLDWLSMLTSDVGTAGSSAYAFYGDLPLLQIASVTGIWSLTFLPNWLASVVNLVWERRVHWRTSVISFVAVMLAVLLFGGVQLAFFRPAGPTVRVAALAPDRVLSDRAKAAKYPQPGTASERAEAKAAYLDPMLDNLFTRSREAARGGARIIAWSEAAAFVYADDLPATIERARQLAREEGVYLQLGLISIRLTDRFPINENRAVLVTPDGTVAWNYAKSKPTPGDGHVAGPGIVPVVDTPYGRLATIICQDDMFPGLVAQAGAKGADILLLPSSDWQAIADWHTQLAVVRAVENGVAVVRATRQGTSLALDRQGRQVAYQADYFTGDDQTMLAALPTSGSPTLYPHIGDVFAYLSSAALVVLVVLAAYRRLRGVSVTPPSPTADQARAR